MSTNRTDPNESTIEHKQSELLEIRKDLREKQVWIPSDRADLYQEVSEWVLASHDLPMGSIKARVQSRLLSLQETPKHKLRPHRGVDDPEEAFPDACEGCTHYGGRCPVIASKLGQDTLERHYAQADSDEELLGRLSTFASKRHCDVLKEEIESGQTTYREFVKTGERLRATVNAAVSDIDLSELDETGFDFSDVEGAVAATADQSTTGLGEPPDEETAQRVEDIVEQVTADDEEEHDG